jgi:V8-like Glu-specific endopeptidase
VSEYHPDPHSKDNDTIMEGNTMGTVTCQQSHNTILSTGTAVLISKSLLLTAGHAVGKKGCKVYALPPGFEASLIDASSVWEGKNLPVCRYTFEVFDRIFQRIGSDYIDLAVLKIDSVGFPHPVSLGYNIKPRQGKPIDVIGYPSNYNEKWIKEAHGQITDVQSSFQDVLGLLPKWRVVTSTGEIISVDKNNIRYKLSTTPGMSGGAVLYEGKVIGTTEELFSLYCRCSYWCR